MYRTLIPSPSVTLTEAAGTSVGALVDGLIERLDARVSVMPKRLARARRRAGKHQGFSLGGESGVVPLMLSMKAAANDADLARKAKVEPNVVKGGKRSSGIAAAPATSTSALSSTQARRRRRKQQKRRFSTAAALDAPVAPHAEQASTLAVRTLRRSSHATLARVRDVSQACRRHFEAKGSVGALLGGRCIVLAVATGTPRAAICAAAMRCVASSPVGASPRATLEHQSGRVTWCCCGAMAADDDGGGGGGGRTLAEDGGSGPSHHPIAFVCDGMCVTCSADRLGLVVDAAASAPRDPAGSSGGRKGAVEAQGRDAADGLFPGDEDDLLLLEDVAGDAAVPSVTTDAAAAQASPPLSVSPRFTFVNLLRGVVQHPEPSSRKCRIQWVTEKDSSDSQTQVMQCCVAAMRRGGESLRFAASGRCCAHRGSLMSVECHHVLCGVIVPLALEGQQDAQAVKFRNLRVVYL